MEKKRKEKRNEGDEKVVAVGGGRKLRKESRKKIRKGKGKSDGKLSESKPLRVSTF